MKVKIWKNEMGDWVREEKVGWTIVAKAYKTKAAAYSASEVRRQLFTKVDDLRHIGHLGAVREAE